MSSYGSKSYTHKATKYSPPLSWREACIKTFQFGCVAVTLFGLVAVALIDLALLGWLFLSALTVIGIVAFVRYGSPSPF
jgi:hypothetical protein